MILDETPQETRRMNRLLGLILIVALLIFSVAMMTAIVKCSSTLLGEPDRQYPVALLSPEKLH